MECNVGDNVIIQQKTGEILECTILTKEFDYLSVKNVVEQATGCKIGNMFIYYIEIASLKVILSKTPQQVAKKLLNGHNGEENVCLLIKEDEFLRLKDLINDCTYYASMDHNFHKNINYLANCETVGLEILRTDMGRSTPISLLLFSSWDSVHIFDIKMFNMKEFPPEIKDILVNEGIRKVVHDARFISDCFEHYYGINIQNLYSIMVADAVIQTKKNKAAPSEGRSLTKCLQHYFNFPPSMINTKVPSKLWSERPLKEEYKRHLAQLVAYLISLKNVTEKALLEDLYNVTTAQIKETVTMSAVRSLTVLQSTQFQEETQNSLVEILEK